MKRAIELYVEDLGFAVEIGDIAVTECQMVNQFTGGEGRPPRFTRGYGLAFGHTERKAMAMALVDRALRAGELGEEREADAGPGVRAIALRQRAGIRLRPTLQISPLRRFSIGARVVAPAAAASGRKIAEAAA